MAGQTLEESYKVYNGTLEDVKDRPIYMPVIIQRIKTTVARKQGNIKGNVLGARLQIQKATEEQKRGPRRSKAKKVEERHVVGGG